MCVGHLVGSLADLRGKVRFDRIRQVDGIHPDVREVPEPVRAAHQAKGQSIEAFPGGALVAVLARREPITEPRTADVRGMIRVDVGVDADGHHAKLGFGRFGEGRAYVRVNGGRLAWGGQGVVEVVEDGNEGHDFSWGCFGEWGKRMRLERESYRSSRSLSYHWADRS